MPAVPRRYTAKAKNAQEAHEAIRPTDLGRLPKTLRGLEPDQAKLYDLIWTRTIACQMESAELERTSVEIAASAGGRTIDLRATGQVVKFDGFLRLYQEGRDDDADEEGSRLPAMRDGETLSRETIEATQHFTEPPPRFTEATLIKRMEELGIGRPSTYASTLAVLRDRDYVKIDKKRLVPEDKGRLVIAFLESFFKRYVEYDFTAGLEEKLDLVSNSEIDWKEVLRDFWRDFSGAIDDIKDLRVTEVLDALNDLLGPHIFPDKGDGTDPRKCRACADGRLSLKVGKFGAFIGCSNYPECRYTRPLNPAAAEGEQAGNAALGTDPETGAEVTLRDGRFGPYIQLGEQGEDKDAKPKRSSLPRGLKPEDVTLAKALALLALPREIAKHPESGEPILAGIGRYGPYVQHGKTYANLAADDDVLEIGGNRAIDLIVEKESGRGGGGRFGGSAGAGRALGDHPQGGAVAIKAGRFGAYVNWGKINATLPKGTNAEAVTMEEAVALLAAKASGAPSGGGRVVGAYPGHGDIVARAGRYGAYVSIGKVNATLPDGVTLESVSLDDAIALIDAKGGPGTPAKGGGRKTVKKPAAKTAAKSVAKTPAAKTPAAKTPAAKKPAAESGPIEGARRQAEKDGRQGVTSARGVVVGVLRDDEVEPAIALWDEARLLRPWNDPRADIALALGQAASTVLVGRSATSDGERLVATVMVGHDGHRGWVYYLAVASDHRKRGFGAAMMRAAEAWVRAQGVPKLQLMVRGDNAATQGFYAAMGYARSDVVVMAKVLGHDEPEPLAGEDHAVSDPCMLQRSN